MIDEFTLCDEDIELLKTIPGTIKAYVDDIGRFETYKQFSAYCGLTPFVKFSNDSGYYGYISNRGPAELRTNMVQAVMGMLRVQKRLEDVSLIMDYKRMKKVKGSGKSIIVFSRKLSRIIYVMLKTRSEFDPEKHIRRGYDAAS